MKLLALLGPAVLLSRITLAIAPDASYDLEGYSEPFFTEEAEEHAHRQTSELNLFGLNLAELPIELPRDWQSLEALCREILWIDADVVYLQGVDTQDAAYTLYEALHEHYAHFCAEMQQSCGVFVASKHSIENHQFTALTTEEGWLAGMLLDCTVQKGEDFTGHLYLAHLPIHNENALMQITERMGTDFLAEKEIMSFFLGGDFGMISESEQMKNSLLGHYFGDKVDCQSGTCALLLESVPSSPEVHANQGYKINTLPSPIWSGYAGILTSITEQHPYLDDSNSWSAHGRWQDSHLLILSTHGQVEVKGGQDFEGTSTVTGSVSIYERSESGVTYSAGLTVEGSRDRDGQTTGKIEGGLSAKW